MMLVPKLLQQRLSEGDEHAQVVKGLQAENNSNPDYATAKKYFEAAARNHYGVAESLLGDMYGNGDGVKRDDDIAFQHYLAGATSIGLVPGRCSWLAAGTKSVVTSSEAQPKH